MEKSGPPPPIGITVPDYPPPSYFSVINSQSQTPYTPMQPPLTSENDPVANQLPAGMRIHEHPISVQHFGSANDPSNPIYQYNNFTPLNGDPTSAQPITVYAPPTETHSRSNNRMRWGMGITAFIVCLLLIRLFIIMSRTSRY